ncbi:conserved exported hypothetical protein [Acidobacteriia bacterium SbA2]|nr:conserved exported hypothetical protein [Acidobacteriia bacterium SbA2]
MKSLLGRLYREQNGQALYLVAASLVAILGMAALSIDIGFALHAQRELQANTDAAASAGGAAMPNPATTSVYGVVTEYSGSKAYSALYNVHPDLNITNVSVSFTCLSTTTYPGYSLPPCAAAASYPSCGVTASNPAGGCNAIKVVETATEPTFFGKILGFKSLTVTATSVASASGGGAIPYHIMLVLDTTNSMGSGTDTGCVTGSSSSYTPEQCAQFGVQTLLSELAPCAVGVSSCGSSAAVDEVGVMSFPGICSDSNSGVTTANCPTLSSAAPLTNTTANPTYAPNDYACPAVAPPIAQYNNDPEYLVVGFGNDYRLSDNSALNWSSDVVKTDGAGTNNCGMPTPGGEGTFYAGAIVAAQTYLTNNHASHVQDIMILLSDGNASASTTQMGGNVKQAVTGSQIAGMNGNLFSATAECTQAVNAAAWARGVKQSDGTSTQIYSISYGSETSGCTSGESVPSIGGNPANTPCSTMAGISSTPLSQYFFSVPQTVNGNTSTVCKGAVPITQLSQVFTTIGSMLETARLIPLNVAGTWVVATS